MCYSAVGLECSVCKLCKRVRVKQVIVVTNVKIVNKPIDNLTGVFGGVTLYNII
jgi:hypothetical protein